MTSKLAQIVGDVQAPSLIKNGYGTLPGQGPANLVFNILKLILMGAGIYAIVNLATAGYGFMSANGDSKKVADAWAKIWQTLIGLIVAAGSFVLASIFSRLVYGNWSAIFQIEIYGP